MSSRTCGCTRDEAGKPSVSVRGRDEKLPVSRLYAHLFKAMCVRWRAPSQSEQHTQPDPHNEPQGQQDDSQTRHGAP